MATDPAPSSAHRLPTVSASDALQKLHGRGSRTVSTGLTQLDKILTPYALPGRDVHGGFVRGKVTEIYGPPGVGKTTFGIQAAASALKEGQSVVWIEAGAPLVPQRLSNVLAGTDATLSPATLQDRFFRMNAPTLAHVLALIMHPPRAFPPPNTSLIVIDSLSTLIENAYPRNADHRSARNKNERTKWAAGRRLAVINELIGMLARVAAMHDIALLITCQTITRIRGSSRALLVPAISTAEWESSISTRLVLFRDWIPMQGKLIGVDADRLRKARFVGVVKVNGVTLADEGGAGSVVPFVIDSAGVRDITVSAADIAAPAILPSESRPLKRRFTEIEDSDSDELYGWVDDDAVAAEGLLIDEPTALHDLDTAAAHGVPGHQQDSMALTRSGRTSPERIDPI
ncbi:P-loop containing nucleoside triphosphate hydrolase protein [Westerdykella ornata]|uniref:P-loop containing nucleoside triphosphate hydrolase protein n=1 Tax=Westerdykella ornata TaxID=318751 RepID=A0A6A6JHE3_WESOR|nr:P-loop containing nucleoside triphosphate hydrolase protein [Westerdykella ornata]KAF2275624.1 P-loop containing nucleoside triphosphate hydrolase protein [Westerdykella ornata]